MAGAKGYGAWGSLALALSACGSGSGDVSIDADLAAIEAFNRAYLAAINDEDIDALSRLTTEGHVMLPPGRPPVVGKADNDAANARAFAAFEIDETWTPVETKVAGDFAWQRGTYTVAATPRAGGDTTRTGGSFLRIYARQPDGSWRMIRDMFNRDGQDAPQ
jgi:ketosteroid isomerase-like protein